jgi:hypothetical protein
LRLCRLDRFIIDFVLNLIITILIGCSYRADSFSNTDKAASRERFAKAWVSCFYDSEVLNSSFVHLMKFSAKNPRLRKAAKRYGAF